MARYSATWGNTVKEDWAAAQQVTAAKITVVMQDIEYIAQTHSHDGTTPGSGAILALKDAKSIWYLMGAG